MFALRLSLIAVTRCLCDGNGHDYLPRRDLCSPMQCVLTYHVVCVSNVFVPLPVWQFQVVIEFLTANALVPILLAFLLFTAPLLLLMTDILSPALIDYSIPCFD